MHKQYLKSWLDSEKVNKMDVSEDKKTPLSGVQLAFDLQDDPEKHNDLMHEDLYDWRDLEDKHKQLYYLRKSIIRVARSKNFGTRASQDFADRYALSIYETLEKRNKKC